MEITDMKPQLPLDFSLNVKSEGNANVCGNVKTDVTSVLLSEKGSQSAFKVVTPKNTDGKCPLMYLCLKAFFTLLIHFDFDCDFTNFQNF